ncbi:MAG: flagellar hook capping protein [Clostridium sp.]|nr:flagellar hook capping protein [Acetatifactor muris]MCM1526013.1 hypothetical protein [Bacteroides sp.]MCM1562227.1 flagellar hook capping protein [Clostridium sp.]
MALVAPVEDGKIVETASQSSLHKTNSSSDGMDKDAFLQLLVAQMRYQDPLEPTSNTEYIAQYAQFSQVEQMQNMAASMDLQRASQLVGKEVYIKTTNSSGESEYVRGKVDYVVYESGKAYLSINEALYSIEDLDTVVDQEYINAYDKAEKFVTALNKLPNVNGIDHGDLSDIDELEKTYNEMNDYEKTFIASDKVKELNAYIERAKEIRLAEEEAEKAAAAEEADKTGDADENTDAEAAENAAESGAGAEGEE